MSEPQKHLAVVVGAGPGIGRALARRLGRDGHPILLIAREQPRLDAIAAELRAAGATVLTHTADASDPSGLADAIRHARGARLVGVLAYNAAYPRGTVATIPLSALSEALAVNAASAVAAVQACLEDLTSTGGIVLFTGGGLALRPSGAAGVLSVGKAALRAIAYALADELAPRGVRVRTLTVAGPVAAGTAFDPDTIADALVALPRGDEVELVFTGQGD